MASLFTERRNQSTWFGISFIHHIMIPHLLTLCLKLSSFPSIYRVNTCIFLLKSYLFLLGRWLWIKHLLANICIQHTHTHTIAFSDVASTQFCSLLLAFFLEYFFNISTSFALFLGLCNIIWKMVLLGHLSHSYQNKQNFILCYPHVFLLKILISVY